MSRCSILCVSVISFCLVGCGDSSRVEVPDYDPAAIAKGAIEAFDADASGDLSKSECKSSPFTMERWDSDQDGSITESEIEERIGRYIEKKTGMLNLTCKVTLNGRELGDATVEFVPEDFMGGAIKAAEGTTSADGMVMPAVPEIVAKDPVLTGVQPGLYKIRVTHGDIKLPAKYNDSTILTFDASPLDVIFEALELKLRK